MASFFDTLLAPRRILKYALTYISLYASIAHAPNGTKPKNLIIDTDLMSDVDDAAALLIASTLPHINLLAVNVNVNSTYSALAASAILNHYGHPNVSIGLPRPYTNSSFFDTWAFELGEYASKVAYHWSGGLVPWFEVDKTWEPVELYRKSLAEAEDRSVTIASIGFFKNLSGLLNSTGDKYSNLTGFELVEKKVAELVIMGGGYPSGHEFNFWGDNPSYTAHVVNNWPKSVAVTFLGTEIGEMVSSGAALTLYGPTNDPVKAAYGWYTGYNMTRFSWDPLAVTYACQGLGKWFQYGNVNGYNYIWPNGSNVWMEDGRRTNHHYLRLKIENETVSRELDELYLKGMRMWAKDDL